jgi:hypothetical protein
MAWLIVALALLPAPDARRESAAVDFSGRWVLVSATPVRPGYEQFWMGTEAIIAQTPTGLTIKRVAPLPERNATFSLEGTESENVYELKGQRIARDSRASWNGNTLLISTDTTLPDGQRWLSNILRWSMDPGGLLVIGDSEICGRGECPTVLTTVKYKKAH